MQTHNLSCDDFNFLIGDELIRILLETYNIAMIFTNYSVEIYKPFSIATSEGKQFDIDGENHRGDLASLWDTIGSKVEAVTVSNVFQIRFSDKSVLRIHRDGKNIVGRIQSLDGKTGDDF